MFVRCLLIVLGVSWSVATAQAQPALRARLLGSGFNRPVAVVVDPVVPGAVHVVEQGGRVLTFVNGVPRGVPFLDLSGVISGGSDERGLLGMAFPPDAAATGRVFVNFTNRTGGGNTVIARFTRSAGDPLVVDPASRFDLQWPQPGGGRAGFISQPPFENHKGGNLAFGPDGYLYIGMGDGGSGNDPMNNAQTATTLLGKMLRVDVSGNPPNGYTVPPDNPDFTTFGVMDALPEIWAFGLRNPWRYSFDDLGPGNTGALLIADVGQGDREEINYTPAGRGASNYGWRVFEGSIENPNVGPQAPAYTPVTPPIFDYSHAVGQVVTGGYVYRGAALGPAYQGRYFYADCAVGRIWSLALTVDAMGDAVASDNRDHTAELGGPFRCISSFARDAAGELYFMDFDAVGGGPGTGRVFRIELASTAVVPPGPPTNFTADVQGNSVALTWEAPQTGGAPAGYQLLAGVTPGGLEVGTFPTTATGLFFTGVPTGQYFVRLRGVNAGGAGATTPELTLNVGCTPPAAPATFNAVVTGQVVGLNWSVDPGTIRTVVEVGFAPGTTALSASFNAPAAGLTTTAPPATYFVRARAVNACGFGPPSVERTVVVTP